MDYQTFIEQLPELYENWGMPEVQPKLARFQQVKDQVAGMTTANVMQLLNFAVACLEPDEIYCEIGTYQGTTLIGALLNHPERLAYAVDNFTEFDETGESEQKLFENLSQFGLVDQVFFCNQDFEDFFLDLREVDTESKIGVYLYDGAHDYRSTLLGLLLVRPFLADQALIILDDANWKTVQQASWDFLANSPEAQILLELFTPVPRFPSFWNGLQLLTWDRSRSKNYSAEVFSQHRYSEVKQAIYQVQLFEQRQESLEIVYREAIDLHEQRYLAEAEKKYREYLLWQSQNAGAWLRLGRLYYEGENYTEAYRAVSKSLELDASNGYAIYLFGCVLERLNQVQAAINAYEAALQIEPSLTDAYNNLGNLLRQKDEIEAAKRLYEKAIALSPEFFGPYLNLGNLLLEQGELAAAIAAYEAAQTRQPDNLDIRQNLQVAIAAQDNPAKYHLEFANSFYQSQRYRTASKHYQAYLELVAGSESVYLNLGDCLWQLHQEEAAIAQLKAGLQRFPLSEALHYEFILKLNEVGDPTAAIAQAIQASEQLPQSYTLKLLKALILPIIYDTPEEIDFYHQRYLRELQKLVQTTDLSTPEKCREARLATARFSTFYLTYQNYNMLEPQQLYGELMHRIMAANYPEWVQLLALPPVEKKIRVGYVSQYMHSYSGTLWLTGWFQYADPEQFEIYCYYTGNQPDVITEKFKQYSHVFHHFPGNLAATCQQILSDRLHILVFPEIGMDPLTVQLAALKLAPIQCTAWGHPVTSGLPTIDYYLSCELMEPANPQAHYSETLIQLPNLGIAYPKPDVPPVTKNRSAFGLREDATIFLCCQAPFKYLPQHDYFLTQIARQVPSAQFVFIRADMLKPRLERAFAEAGLRMEDYCVFLPPQPRKDYLILNQLSDVYLDTLGFTGGNTTLDAIACGLPVVTCAGPFMRGCLSSGILTLLGVTETIAPTEAAYIDIAVKLATDQDWRQTLSTQMLQQCDRVFDDRACVTALEQTYRQLIDTFHQAST